MLRGIVTPEPVVSQSHLTLQERSTLTRGWSVFILGLKCSRSRTNVQIAVAIVERWCYTESNSSRGETVEKDR